MSADSSGTLPPRPPAERTVVQEPVTNPDPVIQETTRKVPQATRIQPEPASSSAVLTRLQPSAPERTQVQGAGAEATRVQDPRPESSAEFFAHALPPTLVQRLMQTTEIATGGESTVYLCHDVRTGEEYALKIYNSDRVASNWLPLNSAEYREHFPEEHTVRILERDRYGRRCYELMEYCPAGTLKDLLDQRGPLPPEQVIEIARQLSEALATLSPLLHGDLKPSNVLVRTVDPLSVVLTDFGLTIDQGDRTHVTNVGRQGTVAYLGPGDAHQRNAQSDWWALGMTLLDLVLGYNFFNRPDGRAMQNDEIEAFMARQSIPLEDVSDSRLRLLLAGLLTRDPSDRWNIDQVCRWLAGESPPVAERAGSTAVTFPRGWTQRTSVFPVDLGKRTYTDSAAVAQALRDHWEEATDRIGAGAEINPVLDWVQDTVRDAPIRRLRSAAGDGRAKTVITVLASVLDPSAPLFYGAFSIDQPVDLQELLRRAGDPSAQPRQRAQAVNAIKDLFHLKLLSSIGVADRHRQLVQIQGNWERCYAGTNRLLQQIGHQVDDETLLQHTLWASLPGAAEALQQISIESVNDQTLGQEWFRRIWQDQNVEAAVRHVFALCCAGDAAEQTRQEQEIRERQHAERVRQAHADHAEKIQNYQTAQQKFRQEKNAITSQEFRRFPKRLAWSLLVCPVYYLLALSLEHYGYSNAMGAQKVLTTYTFGSDSAIPMGFLIQPIVAWTLACALWTAANVIFGPPTRGRYLTRLGALTGIFFLLEGVEWSTDGFTNVFVTLERWMALPLWVAAGHALACCIWGSKYLVDRRARNVAIPQWVNPS
jgi:serine/threonine protein kinase